MVNQELVKQLLKELEAEKGCPVQIRIDTPESGMCVSDSLINGSEYFGSFYERSVMVRMVDNLENKYVGDVGLIEGEYESLIHLQAKIEELNALHISPIPGSLAEKAYELVEKETGVNNLVLNGLSWNFCESGVTRRGGISSSKVYDILNRAGFVYLKHDLVARPNGIYHDLSDEGSVSAFNETKVADITLKMMG